MVTDMGKYNKKHVLFTKETSAWFRGLGAVMIILSHYAEWWAWFFREEGTRELIRYGLSRLGPYGVAVFLLFSGYGLSKSAGEKRIGLRFVLKRIISVYIPYLIVVLLIETASGSSLEDLSDIWFGHDFWYMTVMFVLYLAFMAIWFLFQNRHLRADAMVVFTYVYSNHLYRNGEYDFWYISNIAFAIGVLLALYEKEVLKWNRSVRVIFMLVFGAGSACAVRFAISGVQNPEYVWTDPVANTLWRILAITVFTLFVACFASLWKYYDPVGRFLGKYSLYFYLSHTFLFMWAINYFEYGMTVRFGIATVLILFVSTLLGMLITYLTDIFYQKVQYLVDFKRKKG